MATGFWDAFLDLVTGSACVGCGAPGRMWCAGCDVLLPSTATRVRPRPCPEDLVPCWSSAEYSGAVADLVVGLKERRQLALVRPLARMLAVSVRGAVPDPTDVLLVPVPSRPATRRQRGHDPMGALARIAARELRGLGYRAEAVQLLVSSGPVADQAGLDAAARSANLARSMACPAERLGRAARRAVGPTHVVVCDDVLTTGSTVREAQRALTAAGVPLRAVATVAATRRRAPEPR